MTTKGEQGQRQQQELQQIRFGMTPRKGKRNDKGERF
jgi:hypothetical protein